MTRTGLTVAFALALGSVAAGVGTTAGCTQPRSERCTSVCAREAECREELGHDTDDGFDEKECVAACASLETDKATAPLVAAHTTCVKAATTCPAVLGCK